MPEKLRNWQLEALESYRQSNKENYLIAACPGAGKTRCALNIARYELLDRRDIDLIIIATPSAHLTKQWMNAAARHAHIQLNPVASDNIPRDRHGFVVTYQSIAIESGETCGIISRLCEQYRVLAILDEPHHLGETLSWADKVAYAFAGARQRLLLTGTPFRSDNFQIPYVEYEPTDDGLVSKVDFSHPYGRALADGVVRPVYFETYDGNATWFKDGVEHSAIVSDMNMSKRKEAELRKHIMSPEGEYIKNLLIEANNRLQKTREDAPNAAGLITVPSIGHALALDIVMRGLFGVEPVIVTSDDAEASKRIESFENGKEPWLIAVKMVSEGVDIPRIRVLVYATNIRTDLYFMQFLGRGIRLDKHAKDDVSEQYAIMFIPRFQNFVALAEKIKEEVGHVIEIKKEEILEDIEEKSGGGGVNPVPSSFVSSDSEYGGAIYDGESFDPSFLEFIRNGCHKNGIYKDSEVFVVAKVYALGMFSRDRSDTMWETPKESRAEENKPIYMEIHNYTRKKGTLSKLMAQLREMHQGRISYKDIQRVLNKRQGIRHFSAASATLEQCYERTAILQGWVERGGMVGD